MRRLVSKLVPLVAAVALLAGCAGGEQAAPDPLSQVQVTGGVGTAPTVTIGDISGIGGEAVREVVVAGTGPDTTPETQINASMAVFDGATKQQVVAYQPIGQIFTPGDPTLPSYFADLFVGVPAGSRIVAIIPGEIMLAESGQAVSPSAGPSAPAVIVADVDTIPALAAWGEEQPPTQDLVTVTDGEGGAPQITVTPGAAPPAELVLETRKLGDGAVVADGDTVVVQYTGVLFATGAEFDSSWSRGQPAQFATTDVVPGFGQGMVGQTVGSQIIAIIPPDLAYGDQDTGTIPPGSTLVFVIDILAVL